MKFTMLDMSTCHITKETNEMLLNESIQDAVYYQKPGYGFFINVPDDLEDAENGDVPGDLYKCMKFAQDDGCQWINLDCDGTVIDKLPQYEW